MSLQVAAKHLASKGRGPDTMLVHMAPGEVKSLQELAMAHGGTLTTNPDTGLPEAGFLSSILPMVAGAALAPLTAGTSLAFLGTPMGAALTVGGLQALRTGSLQKGLMAGLGAYSGAGIGDVVGKAGTAAIEAGATGAAPITGAVTPPSPIVYPEPGVATAGANEFAQYMQPTAPAVSVTPPATSFAYPEPGVATSGANEFAQYMQPTTPAAPPVTPPPVPNVPNQLDLMSDRAAALREAGPMGPFTRGIEEIGKDPSKLFNKENLKYGVAGLGSLMLQEPKSVQAPRDTEQYRYAYSPGREMPPTRMGDVGEYTYFRPSYTRLAADGGIMNAMPVQQMSDANNAEMLALNRSQMFAKGGISHLGDYSDGGRLLRGPGDGVSDSIPATIANKRPARLADGEFVVPARIVSELGNGSTDAGARKLYAMMDRVQKNRRKTVGKGKVAVNSRSEKLLPA